MRTIDTALSFPELAVRLNDGMTVEVFKAVTFHATDVLILCDLGGMDYTVIEVPNSGPAEMFKSAHKMDAVTYVSEGDDDDYFAWQEAVADALSKVTTADGDQIRYCDSLTDRYLNS